MPHPRLARVLAVAALAHTLLACEPGEPKESEPCCARLCGNGVIDAGEVCDDGNDLDGDACAAGCDLGVDATPLAIDFDPSTLDFIERYLLLTAGAPVFERGYAIVRRADLAVITASTTLGAIVDGAIDDHDRVAIATLADSSGVYAGLRLLSAPAEAPLLEIVRNELGGSRAEALVARPGGGFVLAYSTGRTSDNYPMGTALQFWSAEMQPGAEVPLDVGAGVYVSIHDMGADDAAPSSGFCVVGAYGHDVVGAHAASFSWDGTRRWSKGLDPSIGDDLDCHQLGGNTVLSFLLSAEGEGQVAFEVRDADGDVSSRHEAPPGGHAGVHPTVLVDEHGSYVTLQTGAAAADNALVRVDARTGTRTVLRTPRACWSELERVDDDELVAVGYDCMDADSAAANVTLLFVHLPGAR